MTQAPAQFKTSDFNFDNQVLDAVNLALKKRLVCLAQRTLLVYDLWCALNRHFRNKPLVVHTNEKAMRDLLAIGELERIKAIKPYPGANVYG